MNGKLAWAVAFFIGISVGAIAAVYLTPCDSSLEMHEEMARQLRLAEEKLDECEAGR